MTKQSDITHAHPRIVVAGAGNVGCFVGGLLTCGAHHVTLLLRQGMFEEISRQGLTISDFSGLEEELSPDAFRMSTKPDCLKDADIILVTVKSGSTADIANLISKYAPKEAIVISLQNGVGAAGILRDMLPEWDVRAAMVPFNVVSRGGGWFHRGSSGDIVIAKGKHHVARTLSVPDLTFFERAKMTPLQWGKVLINLTNALNALSGMRLKAQLGNMAWRRLMADQISEAVRVLKASDIQAVLPIGVRIPVRYLPIILRLPTPLFRLISKPMLTLDAVARSSMWEDLQKGRRTEIEELQGVIVAMAAEVGLEAPLNARVIELIRKAEAVADGCPSLSVREVRG